MSARPLKGIVGPSRKVRGFDCNGNVDVMDRVHAMAGTAQRLQAEQVERRMLQGEDTVRVPAVGGGGNWVEYQAPTRLGHPVRRWKLWRARRRYRREVRRV